MQHGEQTTRSGYSRRGFLQRAGLGAGALATGASLDGVLAPPTAAAARSNVVRTDPLHFGRLFPKLEPFARPSDAVQGALLALGAKGGLMDAGDPLEAGPVNLITDPSLSANNLDNPTHTAGTTFVGQFIDHDITFDVSSELGVPKEPTDAPNGRTPSLDLDSVFGAGPVASPALYDTANDPAKLLLGSGGVFEDLPRLPSGTAIIGDPRNDDHLIIAGLQCAVMLFHNHAVDDARARGATTWEDAYAEARRITTWHYQWLVVHEHLPQLVGQDLLDDVRRNGRRFYLPRPGEVYMPVEFQSAAYRIGHSMVRPSYRANLLGDGGKPFFGFVFDPGQNGAAADPSDLRGGFRAPRRFVGWQTFFDFGDGQVKRNKRIDTRISTPLFTLPLGAIPSHDGTTALPQRTFLRHLTWGLPSGQSVADAMGLKPLGPHDLSELKPLGFERSTPLWYYALKEAELLADGLRLGPMAGRIVAEVLLGLLEADPNSYLNAPTPWTPTVGAGGTFGMVDLLTYAGVDPATRHAKQPSFA